MVNFRGLYWVSGIYQKVIDGSSCPWVILCIGNFAPPTLEGFLVVLDIELSDALQPIRRNFQTPCNFGQRDVAVEH